MPKRLSHLATRTAIPLALLVAGPFYLGLLLPTWRSWMIDGLDARGLVTMSLYVHHAFMSSPIIYQGSSLLALLLLAIGLRRADSPALRALHVLALAGLLAVPALFRYAPPVVPKPGYAMRWPTRPGPIEGVSKRCQVFFDSPCHHRVLGWTADGELVYARDCNGAFPGGEARFAYAPEQDRLRALGSVDAAALEGLPAAARLRLEPSPFWTAHLGHLAYTRQGDYDSPLDWMIPERGTASPDRQWIAARTRHAIYRTEDIVVLRELP